MCHSYIFYSISTGDHHIPSCRQATCLKLGKTCIDRKPHSHTEKASILIEKTPRDVHITFLLGGNRSNSALLPLDTQQSKHIAKSQNVQMQEKRQVEPEERMYAILQHLPASHPYAEESSRVLIHNKLRTNKCTVGIV